MLEPPERSVQAVFWAYDPLRRPGFQTGQPLPKMRTFITNNIEADFEDSQRSHQGLFVTLNQFFYTLRWSCDRRIIDFLRRRKLVANCLKLSRKFRQPNTSTEAIAVAEEQPLKLM